MSMIVNVVGRVLLHQAINAAIETSREKKKKQKQSKVLEDRLLDSGYRWQYSQGEKMIKRTIV